MKGLFLVSVCIGLIGFFTGCSDDDTYRDTLKSGLEKYYSGEKMDEKEYNAVKSFNKGEEVCHEVPGHKLHFYLEKKGKKIYLFTQRYNIAVAREFTSGKTADELWRYHKWGRNHRVDKTIEKIPKYITYIKQEGLV